MYVKTFKHTPRGCRGGCQTSQSAGKHAHQSVSLPGAVRSDVAARVILCVRNDRDVKRVFFFCSLTKRKNAHSFPVIVSFILCTPHMCFENVHLNAHPILGKRIRKGSELRSVCVCVSENSSFQSFITAGRHTTLHKS